MIEREYWMFVYDEEQRTKKFFFFTFYFILFCYSILTSLFAFSRMITCIKIAFCQPTMTWKRRLIAVNKQNCSYSTRLLFFFVFLVFSLLVLLSPVTCTYSYVTIAALVRRRPLHTNIHTRERASNHSILLTTTTTATIHRVVYVCVCLIIRSVSLIS